MRMMTDYKLYWLRIRVLNPHTEEVNHTNATKGLPPGGNPGAPIKTEGHLSSIPDVCYLRMWGKASLLFTES